MRPFILIILLVFLSSNSLFCSGSVPIDPRTLVLPLTVPSEEWQPLRDYQSEALKATLMTTLKQTPSYAQLIRRKKLAVGIVDLTNTSNIKVAWVNGNTMMYAASLPKIAILYAAYREIEYGRIKETPVLIENMTNMIRYSSNTAATAVIDTIGGLPVIEDALHDPAYKLFDKESNGGLWLGKRYSKKGERVPDPVAGLVHGATVSQVCRFYYLLATGRLINEKRSKQMLDILSNPGIHHKFVSQLDNRYLPSRIYRKSGTWKQWHSDSVMVWGRDPKKRFIFVVMVDDERGEAIIRDLELKLERLIGVED